MFVTLQQVYSSGQETASAHIYPDTAIMQNVPRCLPMTRPVSGLFRHVSSLTHLRTTGTTCRAVAVEQQYNLSTEQVEKFHRDGFLVLPNFADAQEVASLRTRAAELVGAFDPKSISVFSTTNQVSLIASHQVAKSSCDWCASRALNMLHVNLRSCVRPGLPACQLFVRVLTQAEPGMQMHYLRCFGRNSLSTAPGQSIVPSQYLHQSSRAQQLGSYAGISVIIDCSVSASEKVLWNVSIQTLCLQVCVLFRVVVMPSHAARKCCA